MSSTPTPTVPLLDEPPISFLPSLARVVGVVGALVTQQLNYWLQRPGGVDWGGYHWTWHTTDSLVEQLGHSIAEKTVRRALADLQAKGVIVAVPRASIDPRCDPWKRVNAYRIDRAALAQLIASHLPSGQFDRMQPDSSTACNGAIRPTVYRTETTAETSTKKSSSMAAAIAAAPAKEKQTEQKRRRHHVPSGLVYWYQDECTVVEALIDQYGLPAVRAAVTAFEARGEEPLPGKVAKELKRQQRTALDEEERRRRREGQQKIEVARNDPATQARTRAAMEEACRKLGKLVPPK